MLRIFNLLAKVSAAVGIGKIPGAYSVYKSTFKLLRPRGIILIDCDGHKMHIDANDRGLTPTLLATGGIYEPFSTELLKNLLKENMVVVNVGANIGYHALVAARCVGPLGKVYAFEPESKNYALLLKNIEANGYKNIIPVPCALGGERGTRRLFLDKSNQGAHSLAEQNLQGKGGFKEVEINQLDIFLEKYDRETRVDLIQMDTQGAEGLILEGAKRVMKNNNIKVIMEFWPHGLKNLGTDALSLLERLEREGFKLGLIDEENSRVNYLPPEKVMELYQSSKNGNWWHANLILKRI